MPFDSKPEARPTSPPPFVPGREGLAQLARLLRQDMPQGFMWDFAIGYDRRSHPCGSVGCAYGLCCHLWPELFQDGFIVNEMAVRFGISHEISERLFINVGNFYGKRMFEITPEDVANAIDRYLARGRL